jgi:biotin operon repressor
MKTEEKMTKEQLIEIIENQKQIIEDLQNENERLKNKTGRKTEVLELLKNNDSISITQIAERLNISTKNVSSQLTYLRQDGYNICTNSSGRKFLVK